MAKNKDLLQPAERIEIWNELLNTPDGTTCDEFCKRCALKKGKGSRLDYQDIARQDKVVIRRLLRGTGVKLMEETEKSGKKGPGVERFHLSENINLIGLYEQDAVKKPYQELMKLLVNSSGLLSKKFLAEVSEVYGSIMDNTDDDNTLVDFESSYNPDAEMQNFTEIYPALRKKVLLIDYHNANKPDNIFTKILYPEYLKEYKSQWFVIGNIADDDEDVNPHLGRIPLSMIDYIDELEREFIPTGMLPKDYATMFEEIVGVERDLNCPVEEIKLRVSSKMYPYIKQSPLHCSQTDCKELDGKGFKGIEIHARKNKELIRSLLYFGSDIEVVSPQHLRSAVKRELNKAMKKYL